jgi:hypothetical protein
MKTSSNLDRVLELAQKLSKKDQLLLIETLSSSARAQKNSRPRSILELQGLGKEIWEGVDAQDYVSRERAAWIG